MDGWPQFSDAVVDYNFDVKLAYHYIRRIQRPVSVILGEQGPGKRLPVIISNDSRNDADVRYEFGTLIQARRQRLERSALMPTRTGRLRRCAPMPATIGSI